MCELELVQSKNTHLFCRMKREVGDRPLCLEKRGNKKNSSRNRMKEVEGGGRKWNR